jgi:ABC-2 type transport system permease protein
MLTIFRKEISSFFSSLIAYVIIAVFLTGTGLLVWIYPQTNILDYGYAEMGSFFDVSPFVFMFLIPAVTMRTFAEEKRNGTLELLFTRPLTDWDIILGKFFACWLLIILTLLPTLLYYYSIYQLGNPVGNLDTAGIAGSYIGLVLLAGIFTAIGILASSLTDNQIVAFVIGCFSCYLLYGGLSSVTNLNMLSNTAFLIQQLGIDYHYQILSKGLIDSRNVLYFVSITVILLLATRLKLESRKW